MGKTIGLFKKIRETKRIFHGKMGTIKDRNAMDPTEAEENTQKNYTKKKKNLNDPENYDGMITHQ